MGTYTYNAWQLATLADCGHPDEPDSPGARWLLTVASVADELTEIEGENEQWDAIHEYADSLVPVYTHERWQVFVDLTAYREDTHELGDDGRNLTQSAGVALYMIAERLLYALVTDDAYALTSEAAGQDEIR